MSRSRRPSKQQKQRTKGNAGRDFWGSVEQVPDAEHLVRPAADAAAVVHSLGNPPLPGHEQVAEHYFRAVYERAALLATALAQSGGILDDGGDD